MEEEYGDRQEKRIYYNCFILKPSINDLGMRLTSEMTYLKFCHTGLRLLRHKHNNKRFSLFLGRCPVIYSRDGKCKMNGEGRGGKSDRREGRREREQRRKNGKEEKGRGRKGREKGEGGEGGRGGRKVREEGEGGR